MLSVLTTFAPCSGNKMRTQEVAAYSMSRLVDTGLCEVLVFDEHDKFGDLCRAHRLIRVTDLRVGKDVGVNSPALLMDSMFGRARELAHGDTIAFINGDNVFTNERAPRAFKSIYDATRGDFACLGRRLEMREDERDALFAGRSVEETYTAIVAQAPALPRIPYGVDVYAWSRSNFERMKLLPVLIDGWHYDNWLVNEAYALTKNVFYLSGWVDTVHCYHGDSAYRQATGTGSASTTHNKRVIVAAYPGVDTAIMTTPPIVPEDFFA